MKQETLDLIGRHHTVEMFIEKFHLARSMGFDNINTDLIVGLPNETLDDLKNTMEGIKKLAPDDVTVHALAIKRAARLNTKKEDYADLKCTGTWDMLMNAPDDVEDKQLNELAIKIDEEEVKAIEAAQKH